MVVKNYTNKITAPLFRECYHIKNLIPNANMKSGWNASGSSSPAAYNSSCYSITLTGTASTNEVLVQTISSIPLINTHVYYRRFYGYQSTYTAASCGSYWPIAEPSFTDGQPLLGAGAWRVYSAVRTRTEFSNGNYQFRLDFNNNKIAGSMSFSCPMLIDLTETFGAGHEPDQTWCDSNIPFFESTYTLNVSLPVSISTDGLASKNLIECLPNIVIDGSFETGTGWSGLTTDTSQHLFGSKSSKLGTSGTVINTRPAIKPIVNHVYYGRHSIKTDGLTQPADCRFEWFAGDGAGLNFVFGWNTGNHPSWYTESVRMKIDAVNGTNYIIRNFVVNSGTAANVYCDGLMIVDLTAAFGAGHEPSKEWCDTHLVFSDHDEVLIRNAYAISVNGLISTEFQEV